MKKKVLIVLGPTASGKSDLAVRLAKKFKGEIISADSRQVYKELNVGSGKITKKEMLGVKHYLLDVASPKRQFSAAQYLKLANQALVEIIGKDKLPIVVGGTGFYIDTLTGKKAFPDVPPNLKLRDRLEKLSNEKLFQMLEKKDPERAGTIDKNNPVRLIRALEIVEALGKVPQIDSSLPHASYSFKYIGLTPNNLDERISKRLKKRLSGMIREAKRLLRNKILTHRRMNKLGLEYRYLSLYLQSKLEKEEMLSQLETAIRQYARRQMVWFKKNKEIKWFTPSDTRSIESWVRNVLR